MGNKKCVSVIVVICITVLSEYFVAGRVEKQRIAEDAGHYLYNTTVAPFTAVCVARDRDSDGETRRTRVFCTGVIIDPRFVLTAAHCVEALDDILGIYTVAEIYAGVAEKQEIERSDTDFIQFREMNSQNSIIHPNYKAEAWWEYLHPSPSKYDVALVQVEAFTFNDHVNKAQLWDEEWPRVHPTAAIQYSTMQCEAYGWGTLKGTGSSLKESLGLRAASVQAVHGTSACPNLLGFQQRRLVCSQNPTICPGDSGGPLVCQNKIVGIAHILYRLNPDFAAPDCNVDDVVNAWIYICPMLEFIHKHVPSAPVQPISCVSPPLTPAKTALLSGIYLVASKFMNTATVK